jgi:hypothetical protein
MPVFAKLAAIFEWQVAHWPESIRPHLSKRRRKTQETEGALGLQKASAERIRRIAASIAILWTNVFEPAGPMPSPAWARN